MQRDAAYPPIDPHRESLRLAAIERLAILDTGPEPTFDRIAESLAHILGVRFAMITLVDRDRCWYKADYGTGFSGMTRDHNMCDAVIQEDRVFVIEDSLAAEAEGRFVGPLLRAGLRFYIGAPIHSHDGVGIGTLAAVDTEPRQASTRDREIVASLAGVVSDALESRLATLHLERAEAALRQANTQLERANRNKNEFLASMSHELRTPLNGILGASELLDQGLFGDLNEKQREYVQDIHQSGEHLLSLINDVLDLARIEAGQTELRLEAIDVAGLMDQCIGVIRGVAMSKSLSLRVRPPQPSTPLTADERRMTQIACNLLSNAVKFAPEGSTVTFSAEIAGDHLVLTIEDEGPGIDPEHHERIFDQFFRLPSNQEGTGLGLPLARRLAELHGGRIWLDSDGQHGSRFSVAVPLSPLA